MRRSVTEALSYWRREGLLTEAQVAALSASLEHLERRGDSARAARIFGIIGAVLSGLGAVLWVASNWHGMSPMQRVLVLLAGYGATVATAALVERRGLPLLSEAVWLLSTLLLGANIFLIAQSYNLSLTLWQGTLAWMIGALAMGYARQSAAQAAVAVPLLVLTLGWAGGGSGWFFDDQIEFLFADGGLRPVLPLLGLALVALSTLLPLRRDLAFARAPFLRWGLFLLAATLILTTAHVELAAAFYDAEWSLRQGLVAAAAAVLVLAAALAGEVESRFSRPVLVGLLAFLAVPLVPVGGQGGWLALEPGGVHVYFGLYVIAVFALAVGTIQLGVQARNARLVNVGMLSTMLIIIIQYFGWSFELFDRSLAFILGGLVLMALSVFVERSRRRLLANMEVTA